MAESPSRATGPADGRIDLGRITGPFGVRGWVKIMSYTVPPEQILAFPVWRADLPGGGHRDLTHFEGRRHGKGLVARLKGIDDRDQAAALARQELWIERHELPALKEGEYYQADLVGLEVVNLEGHVLGRVDRFLDTGANAVMVVIGEREHWLPMVSRHVPNVDLGRRRITVDWDPDF
ncbi:MAG: ribosome maturation factor RimM [Gammaproteobacteria bacterium]|nr:ribosome maturation factor RimM [Gammaproteobacteria bacterium]